MTPEEKANIFVKEYDEHKVSSLGMPVCPICGKSMLWAGDYEPGDIGYADPGDETNEEDIFGIYECEDCCILADMLIDLGFKLLAVYTRQPGEEDEEPGIIYTDLAKEKYKAKQL